MKKTKDLTKTRAKNAEQLALRARKTLRALIEYGIRRTFGGSKTDNDRSTLKDARVGGNGLTSEFGSASWPDIRDAAYEDRSR